MDGTPLPGALSGNIAMRLIEIDEAFLYLVTGALDWLLDHEPLEQTGALTVEQARGYLSDMFYIYLEEEVNLVPVGASMLWHTDDIPDGWLACDGQAVSRADYPKLFDLWGVTFGAGDGSTTFNLPDFQYRIPMGAGIGIDPPNTLGVGEDAGAQKQTINISNLPAHSHLQNVSGSPAYNSTGGTGRVGYGTLTTSSLTRVQTENTGGGTGLPSIPPVQGVHFLVRAR